MDAAFHRYRNRRDTKAHTLGGLNVGQILGCRPARNSDQNKQLTGYEPLLTAPGLNEVQTTKLNAFIRTNPAEAMSWLSPRQRAFLEQKAAVK